jgi:uncharacterized DUF497 family protein
MNFEFDPVESAGNRVKHGISLADAQLLWSSEGVEFDLGMVNGEFGYARIAPFRAETYIAIFSFRGSTIRLISARRTTDKEALLYEQNRKK